MKKIEIDCKKAEKMIPGFIKGKLTDSDTTVLLDHVETCESCREELTIQYFISEGLDSVDENGDYDLLNGFNKKILNSRNDIRVRANARDGFIACVVGVMLVIVFGAMMVVI